MRSWLRIGIVGAGALAVMLAPLLPAPASGQVERRKVMVVNLLPMEDADDDFGKDLAKALRELINGIATHQAVDEREIRDAADKYDLDMEDLDCIRSLQLSRELRANIIFCGSYTEDKDADTFTLSGVKFDNPDAPPVEIPDKTWHKDDYELAAQEIAGLFNTFIQRLRDTSNCVEYYQTKEWASAERNCLAVLEQAPNDAQVRLIVAQIYRQTDRIGEAYDEVLKVIDIDPLNDTALELAGWLAITLDRTAEGRAHYDAYLQLNPGDAQVRVRIAYEQAQAGDPEGAMILVEEGLEIEPDNTELLIRHASFAIAAGQAIPVEGETLSPDAGQLYLKGSQSYRRAYGVLGADMDAANLKQMLRALNVLGQLEEALTLADQVLATHGEDAGLWDLKATILRNLDRIDDALMALDEAEARDPNFPNIKAKQGQWLIASGREEEALPFLMEAVEKGEQSADVIANMFFGAAVNKGINAGDYGFALRMIDMAKTFEAELASRTLGQLDFYKAYSIYKVAEVEQGPQNAQSARLTLPKFKEVQSLLGLGHVVDFIAGARPRTQGTYQQLRDGVVQFIEIQELLIERG